MTDVIVFLKRIRTARRELSELRKTMVERRLMLLPSGIRYDKERVQTSPGDRLHETADHLLDLERVEQEQIERLTADILLAEQLIAGMKKAEHRELIRLRYLSGENKPLTWEQIAKRMGYDEDHVRGRLKKNALKDADQAWRNLPQNTTL